MTKDNLNYMSDGDKFETLVEATDNAQKYADSRRQNMDIWQRIAYVKFPVPTYPVEAVTVVAA